MSHKQSKKSRMRLPEELAALINVTVPELNAIADVALTRVLTPEEARKLKASFSTLSRLKELWLSKCGSLSRVMKMLFGPRTEKTEAVLGENKSASPGEGQAEADAGGQVPAAADSEGAASAQTGVENHSRPGEKASHAPIKRKGHGRNAVTALTGARRVPVPLSEYADGEGCPHPLCKGKLYPFELRELARIEGVAPLMATVYECEQKRCNACQDVFTAPPPAGVGEKKYDETATAQLGLIHYSCGLPLNQIEKLQEGYGVPCSASTQWDLLEDGGETMKPAFHEMVRQGAQQPLQHLDDTKKKILGQTLKGRIEALGAKAAETRKGTFTTGVVSIGDGIRMALYFSGYRHAGENFNEMLKLRAKDLPQPIQMGDASQTNIPRDFDTILANCLSHARRGPADVVDDFPHEVRFILETLREVYKVDAEAREAGVSPRERLVLHQEKSKPWMTGLKNWIHRQFDEKLTEPNSTLGVALTYIIEHWQPLTAFLRVENCPLDNNICERLLKKAIRHRKNSLFYRTAHGAEIGDIWMSLIHTAEMNNVSAFEYLVALLRHPKELAENPSEWMPWTFQATLKRMKTVADRQAAQKAAA